MLCWIIQTFALSLVWVGANARSECPADSGDRLQFIELIVLSIVEDRKCCWIFCLLLCHDFECLQQI